MILPFFLSSSNKVLLLSMSLSPFVTTPKRLSVNLKTVLSNNKTLVNYSYRCIIQSGHYYYYYYYYYLYCFVIVTISAVLPLFCCISRKSTLSIFHYY